MLSSFSYSLSNINLYSTMYLVLLPKTFDKTLGPSICVGSSSVVTATALVAILSSRNQPLEPHDKTP